MKHIVVFSDSHNYPLPQRFIDVAREADMVIFCGDGISGLKDFLKNDNFYAVKGNCDYFPLPTEEIITVEDVKIFITHGHTYGVKKDLTNLSFKAQKIGANLVLYGHTHIDMQLKDKGITFINSGSMSMTENFEKTYCYLTIDEEKILSKIVKMA